MAAAVRPVTPDASCAGCAAVLAELAALRRRVEVLEARSGPRDGADVSVLAELCRVTEGRAVFTGREVFAHGRVDSALAAVLEGADLDSPRQLGRLLRRLEGAHDGYLLARVGEDRHGLRWRVSRV